MIEFVEAVVAALYPELLLCCRAGVEVRRMQLDHSTTLTRLLDFATCRQ